MAWGCSLWDGLTAKDAKDAKDAKGVAEARGTFTPGTIDFAKVQAELSGRYDKKVQPYLNIVSAKLNQAQ